MRFSFGPFELDVAARALRREGREETLQPLVFDLLVHLVQHRERVVSKDELLAALWKDTLVTDGSLQRAVSLLRAVLREGGLPDAVQTFARRGYRFAGPLTTEHGPTNGASPQGETDGASGLVAARALVAGAAWQRALDVFGAASPASFVADDWEAWGQAAVCAARPQEAVAPLERAVVGFEARGELARAARAALLLTNVKLELRELAIAKGWHQRAGGHLAVLPESSSHGLAAFLSARFALFEGRLEDCARHAQETLGVAKRLADPELRSLGLVYHGHVLVAQGRVREGLALHDEAGVLALAGSAGSWASGVVFCSVIWACLHLGDHGRAGQWTDEFSRWCARHPSYAFPALCRLHRGEVLAVRGALAAAEQEVSQARGELASSGPYTEGDAWRVLGDIRLSRGELEAAEAAFREAHRLGWNPQPGFAQLLAWRGQHLAALNQLESALHQPGWTEGQRRRILLAVLARIAAMHGALPRARAALAELSTLASESVSSTSEAETARARGELAWAEGAPEAAEAHLRSAVRAWFEASAPVHAAHVRLRLAALLLTKGDAVAADFELGSAEAVFQDVGAAPMLARCREMREAAATPPATSPP